MNDRVNTTYIRRNVQILITRFRNPGAAAAATMLVRLLRIRNKKK